MKRVGVGVMKRVEESRYQLLCVDGWDYGEDEPLGGGTCEGSFGSLTEALVAMRERLSRPTPWGFPFVVLTRLRGGRAELLHGPARGLAGEAPRPKKCLLCNGSGLYVRPAVA